MARPRHGSVSRSSPLVALGHGGELRLPRWQFDVDTPRGRLDGLADVRTVFSGGPVALTQWMTSPDHALAVRTPAAAQTAGKLTHVLAAAEARV